MGQAGALNAIVLDGCTLRLAVPDGNLARGLRFEHSCTDSFADQLRNAAPRPCGGPAQCVELFLVEINR
jgi:hypothetical protein